MSRPVSQDTADRKIGKEKSFEEQRVKPGAEKGVEIVASKLGDDAGITGRCGVGEEAG
jgi:hypothetical protein